MKSTTTSRADRPRKALWRRVVLAVAGIVLAGFIVTGLMPKPVEVEMEAVTRGPLTVSVLEEGKTRIRDRYVVSPPVAGYLKRVPVRAGDPVVAGETLIAVIQASPSGFLDPRTKAQAESAVRSAEATLQQRNEQLQSATAELDLARKELVRAEQLRKKGAIAVKEFDTASNHVDMLNNQLGSVHFALKVAEFEIEQSKAALVQATGESGGAGQPIEIRSPVSGFVLNVFEESAKPVTPGLPIMEIGDPKDLQAEIELLSSDAVNVKPGADVSIEQWGGGEPLRGKVTLVEPGGFLKVSALGVEEQRVKVRVNFTDFPAGVLGDRYRVEARIVIWTDTDVLQVPTGALFRRGNEWMAFVVERGRAKLTKVGVAHSNGVAAEVTNGLSENQKVILHPPDTVSDGAAVKPRR